MTYFRYGQYGQWLLTPTPFQTYCLSELDQLLDYNAGKNRFLWNRTVNDLQNFTENRIIAVNEDHEHHDPSELTVSSNSQCAATLSFYLNTKTLQILESS